MRSIRRIIIGALVVAVLSVPFLLASSASAAPYTIAPTLASSTQNPAVGGPVTLSGTGFTPGTPVQLSLHTKVYVLGNTVVDAGGSFSITARLPAGISGHHTLEATDPAGHILASLSIVIGPISSTTNANTTTTSDNSANGAGSGSGTGSGGLASTGVAVGGFVLVGLVLLVGGGTMLFSSRRRGKASH